MSKQTLFLPKNALGSNAIFKIRQTIADEINSDLTSGTLSPSFNNLDSTAINTDTLRTNIAGTAAIPSIQITDTNCGLYKITTANIGLSTNGTLRCDWNATRMNLAGALYVPNGNLTTPSVTFGGDTNTGIYSVGSDIIGITCGGINGASFTASGPYFSGAITSNRIEFSSAGTTSVPALSFSSDTNTGLYNPSAFTVGIVSGGNESARFTSSGATLKNVVTVDRLQVGSTGKICYWSDWGTTITIGSVPSGGANSISVLFGTTAPSSTISISVSVINCSNPDRVALGCHNVTSTGFDLFYINNYNATITALKFAWTARV